MVKKIECRIINSVLFGVDKRHVVAAKEIEFVQPDIEKRRFASYTALLSTCMMEQEVSGGSFNLFA